MSIEAADPINHSIEAVQTAEKQEQKAKPAITQEDLDRALELTPKLPGAVVASLTERMLEANPDRIVSDPGKNRQEMAIMDGKTPMTVLMREGEGEGALYTAESRLHDYLPGGSVILKASPSDLSNCEVAIRVYTHGEWVIKPVERAGRKETLIALFAQDMFKSAQEIDKRDDRAAINWAAHAKYSITDPHAPTDTYEPRPSVSRASGRHIYTTDHIVISNTQAAENRQARPVKDHPSL